MPLSALLSRALVAFTIELDNEFESRMPHRTTDFGGTRGAVWAVSLRQWSNFMQFVDEDGITVRELTRRSRAAPALHGMRRWRYVQIGPAPNDLRAKPPEGDLIIRPTRNGARAQAVWAPLPGEIELRWRARFGDDVLDRLVAGLEALDHELGAGLPEWITIGYAGFVAERVRPNPPDERTATPERNGGGTEPLPLPALLSHALQSFALEYEDGAKVSLCHAADVVRVLDPDGVRVTELPERSGIAIDALKTAVGILAKRGIVEEFSDPAARRRVARLTERGVRARERYRRRPAEIEAAWGGRFGADTVDAVRHALEAIALPGRDGRSPLFMGLGPPDGTWRSKIPAPQVLPDFPMPRQGGHPDGA